MAKKRSTNKLFCAIAETRHAGRLLQMFLQPRHELNEVAGTMPVVELVLDDVVPAVAARARRAGQGEEIGAAGDAGRRAALDRRGADLLIGEEAEKLAEAGN